MQDVCEPLYKWLMKFRPLLSNRAAKELQSAAKQINQNAEDECAYTETQTRNDYDGWLSPDEVAEYYEPLPLDADGFPVR